MSELRDDNSQFSIVAYVNPVSDFPAFVFPVVQSDEAKYYIPDGPFDGVISGFVPLVDVDSVRLFGEVLGLPKIQVGDKLLSAFAWSERLVAIAETDVLRKGLQVYLSNSAIVDSYLKAEIVEFIGDRGTLANILDRLENETCAASIGQLSTDLEEAGLFARACQSKDIKIIGGMQISTKSPVASTYRRKSFPSQSGATDFARRKLSQDSARKMFKKKDRRGVVAGSLPSAFRRKATYHWKWRVLERMTESEVDVELGLFLRDGRRSSTGKGMPDKAKRKLSQRDRRKILYK